MRKLILISALLLASASAHAGPSVGMELAAADTPAATAQPVAQPLPPVTQTDNSKDSTKAVDAAKPRASRPRAQARRYESDEAKARRIAARYGISW